MCVHKAVRTRHQTNLKLLGVCLADRELSKEVIGRRLNGTCLNKIRDEISMGLRVEAHNIMTMVSSKER